MNIDLSPRELEVARLICEGRKTTTIAQLLSVSPSTIQVHRRSVRLKLNAPKTADVVHAMLTHKLWEPTCSGSSS